MSIINKFLEEEDFKLASFQCLRKEFEHIYIDILNRKPESYGRKLQNQTKIHWSRDWELPWAIINSGVKAGERVLDCGCGRTGLLLFLNQFGCEAYGVDPNIFKKSSLLYWEKTDGGHEIGKDPNELGFKIEFFRESLDKMHFEDNFFDKVFCISVVEHLPEDVAYNGMKEMARVLKNGGLLAMTVDNDGPHVNPKLAGKYKELIEASGLRLYGASDFKKPKPEDVPGAYNVVGFVLEKPGSCQ